MEKMEIIKTTGIMIISIAGGSILALRMSLKRGNKRKAENAKINIKGRR